jgi:hypothetical protein
MDNINGDMACKPDPPRGKGLVLRYIDSCFDSAGSMSTMTDPLSSETPLDKRCVLFLVTANTGSCTANNDEGSTPDVSSNDPLTDPPPSETPLDKRCVSFLVTTNTGSCTANNDEGNTPDVGSNDPPMMNNDTHSTDDALLLTVSFPYHFFIAKYIHDCKPDPPGGEGFVLHYIGSCFDSAESMSTMTDTTSSETPLDKRCVSFLVTTNTGSCTANNDEGSTPDVGSNDPPMMNNDTHSTDDALLLTVSFPYHSFMAKYIHEYATRKGFYH